MSLFFPDLSHSGMSHKKKIIYINVVLTVCMYWVWLRIVGVDISAVAHIHLYVSEMLGELVHGVSPQPFRLSVLMKLLSNLSIINWNSQSMVNVVVMERLWWGYYRNTLVIYFISISFILFSTSPLRAWNQSILYVYVYISVRPFEPSLQINLSLLSLNSNKYMN